MLLLRLLQCVAVLVFVPLLASCGGGHTTRVIETPETRELKGWQKPYEVDGRRYQPLRDHQGFQQRGIASWYGRKFHGRKTSNGEIYNMYALTAAHKTLPLGVYVRVTHLQNGRSVVVRVNDRGPFVAGRIIDLSYVGAQRLGIVDAGTAMVQVQALGYQQTDRGQVSYRPPSSYDIGHFSVQVGAFSVADNAYRLATRLRSRSGKADVQTAVINGRQMYRVRVGEYRSLERAEKAVLDFIAGGFSGSFVVAFD